MYLPVFAVAMVPWALLNTFWASLLWYFVSVLMLAHAVRVSVRLVRKYFPNCRVDDFWIFFLTLLLILWPCISGLARGQASLLVMYLVTMSVVLSFADRHWLSGLCLAGSIVMKIFPGLLLIYFVARRRFAVAGATLVWLFVLLFATPSAVFGVTGNIALLRQWVTTIALPANTPEGAEKNVRYDQMINPGVARNQSVQAVMIRMLAGKTRESGVTPREGLARHVALAINAVLALVSIWACAKGAAPARTFVECCLVILLMLFLSPVSWSHNFSLLAAPLAVGVALAAGQEARAYRIGPGVFFILSTLSLVVKPVSVLGGLLWGTVAIWLSLVAYLLKPPPAAS
jgi:alpha-1,2-mannosyltransferase